MAGRPKPTRKKPPPPPMPPGRDFGWPRATQEVPPPKVVPKLNSRPKALRVEQADIQKLIDQNKEILRLLRKRPGPTRAGVITDKEEILRIIAKELRRR